MNVSFDGIGELNVTFRADSAVTPRAPVKIGAANTVYECSDGDIMAGVCGSVESDGFAAVMLRGFVKLPYSGETEPSPGWERLLADGDGGVKVDGGTTVTADYGAETVSVTTYTAPAYLVTEVDTVNETVCFFM